MIFVALKPYIILNTLECVCSNGCGERITLLKEEFMQISRV